MKRATRQEARAAKIVLRALLSGLPELRGLGVAFLDGGGHAVKVLLQRRPAGIEIPDDVDGVPVLVDVVGELTPL